MKLAVLKVSKTYLSDAPSWRRASIELAPLEDDQRAEGGVGIGSLVCGQLERLPRRKIVP
jgi:hypothetical protein